MPLARFPSFPSSLPLSLLSSQFLTLLSIILCVFLFLFYSVDAASAFVSAFAVWICVCRPPFPPPFFNAESAAIENKKQRKAGAGSGSGGKGGTKNSVWDVYGAFRCTLGTTQHRGHNCPVCRFYWYCHWADIDHYLWLSTRTLLIRSVALKKAWNKHKEKPKLTPDFNCNLYSHLLSKFNRTKEGKGG